MYFTSAKAVTFIGKRQEFSVGKTPQIDSNIEPEFKTLIADMLECEPSKRPAMADVHKRLLQILKPEMGRKNIEEDYQRKFEEERKKKLEEVHGNKFEEEQKRKFAEEHQRKLEEERKCKVDSSGLVVGNGVKTAKLHERNPRKVVLVFENGKEQIMDLRLALRLGYVKN